MEDFEVAVGSARLTASEWPAAGEGRTVVALHAGVADRRMWTACAPVWTAQGWRVVSYDRRGFGHSTWAAEPHDHVADLLAVLDSRGIERAVLVGSSMGGGLAIDTALAHPARVAGLVLVGSAVTGIPPIGDVATRAEQSLAGLIDASEDAGDLDEVNRLECHYWLDGPDQHEGRVQGAPRDLFLAMNGRALAAPAVGERRRPRDAWPRLGEIAVPALVAVGRLDERMILAIADALAQRIPTARLVRLDSSAHLPALDDAAAFAAIVARFLDDC